VASLWQGKDGDTPTVDDIPDGFKLVITRYGPVFRCVSCNIAVEP
jgi:hypothetical protein